MKIEIPEYVNIVLNTLTEAGCEAFVVGGCVRDILMGKEPSDWDVCTSARPEKIKAAFAAFKTIDTGIRHGTVTVLSGGQPVEVTTYRIDGEYLDNRHPAAVEFTRNLTEDLARRDFTMNAMAYSPDLGLADPYGGSDAIKASLIRCVDVPAKRFEEDALRIMRGLRFAAVLGFQIEDETAEAMRLRADLMKNVSRERIHVELSKLIMGKSADEVLAQYGDILNTAAPGIEPGPVGGLLENSAVRLAALFPKDTGRFLRALKYDNRTVKTAQALARLAGEEVPSGRREILQFLRREGEEISRLFFQRAGREEELISVLNSGACYSVSGLAVTGKDLMDSGVKAGPELGRTLEWLLDKVINEETDNEKEPLLTAVKGRTIHE